jgi:hypothetical protein
MSAATASGTLRDLVEHAAQGAKLSRHRTAVHAGGERDFWIAISPRDQRRLWSSGFVSSDGFEPDKFAELVRHSGDLPMELTNANADEVCAWWCRLVLASLDQGAGNDPFFTRRGEYDQGAADREECARLEESEVCTVPATGSELPQWVTDWLGTLIYEPKRAYAEAYCRSVYCGGIAPERLEHPWVSKVESKVARRLAASIVKGGK